MTPSERRAILAVKDHPYWQNLIPRAVFDLAEQVERLEAELAARDRAERVSQEIQE